MSSITETILLIVFDKDIYVLTCYTDHKKKIIAFRKIDRIT